ncbi:MFS transporter [Halomicronema sp. CCY15110]|uniref:MFS transporter n=1 Tax=Halomicronema sp. CCY15110 TaxID=2767773 RepID=UPI001951A980|nr:MFS transporter [Halomicronema sp. CCY15110]
MTVGAQPAGTTTQKSAIGLCLTLFMVSFHLGIVPAIMPPLVRSFDSSVGYVQSALVLLSLVTAAFAPTSENLSRRWGRQRIFHGGLLLFAIGTLLITISPSMALFAVSYALLTGLAATPLVSVPWALMDRFYDGQAEKIAFLLLTLSMVVGGLVGSLTGGLIAFQLSWRLAFPLELLLIPLIWGLVTEYPTDPIAHHTPIDWVGGCLSFLGLGLTLLGLSLAGEFGWWEAKKTLSPLGVTIVPFGISIVPILIGSGLVCLGLFVFWRRQQKQANRASLVKAGLLSRRNFINSLIVAMLHSALITGLSFNLFQFIPPVLDLNSFQTALTVLPYNFVMVIVLLVRFINLQLLPRRIVQLGLSIEIIGILWLVGAIAPGMTRWSILPGLVITGIGSGLFTSQIGAIAYSTATRGEKPEATGIFNPLQKVGQALGRGILGTVLISAASSKIVDGVILQLDNNLDATTRQAAITYLQRAIQTFTKDEMQALFARLPETVQPSLDTIIETAAIGAMETTLIIILVANLVCLLLTTRLPHLRRLKRA